MNQVVGLAVALAEPGEDADDLGMALRAEDGEHRLEVLPVEIGEGGPVAVQHGRDQVFVDVAPRVFQKRHDVVGRRPRHRVLEVQKPTRGHAFPCRQQQQVVHVVVAQHQRPGPGMHQRKGPQPGLGIVFAHHRRRRPPEGRRQVPVGEQEGLVQQPLVVVGRKPVRHRLVRRQAVQADQHVRGQLVKSAFVRVVLQQPGIGVVAEILQQQESRVLVRRQDLRRAETQGKQVAGDANEGTHVLLGRRRVHQNGAGAVLEQSVVAPERGIAGKRAALRPAPTVGFQEYADGGLAVRHGSAPPPAFPASRHGRATPRGGVRPRRGTA